MYIYGVISNGVHVDISTSERGAKTYATKHDYTQVTMRYNMGCNIRLAAVKRGNKWVKSEERNN